LAVFRLGRRSQHLHRTRAHWKHVLLVGFSELRPWLSPWGPLRALGTRPRVRTPTLAICRLAGHRSCHRTARCNGSVIGSWRRAPLPKR
jgi:hypothetical protein